MEHKSWAQCSTKCKISRKIRPCNFEKNLFRLNGNNSDASSECFCNKLTHNERKEQIKITYFRKSNKTLYWSRVSRGKRSLHDSSSNNPISIARNVNCKAEQKIMYNIYLHTSSAQESKPYFCCSLGLVGLLYKQFRPNYQMNRWTNSLSKCTFSEYHLIGAAFGRATTHSNWPVYLEKKTFNINSTNRAQIMFSLTDSKPPCAHVHSAHKYVRFHLRSSHVFLWFWFMMCSCIFSGVPNAKISK